MNIKIIKGWDMFFNHGFHDHLSSSEGPTSAEIDHAPKKKATPAESGQSSSPSELVARNCTCSERGLWTSQGPKGGWYGRWEGDWNGWVGLSWNWPWSIMKPWNIQNYSTFLINGHDTNCFLRFPWSLVSQWGWRVDARPKATCRRCDLIRFFQWDRVCRFSNMFCEQSSFSTWGMEGYGTFIQHPTIWIYMELLREKHMIIPWDWDFCGNYC